MSTARGRRLPPPAALLELLALTGLALAQPLLDVFGRSPEQFAFRDADGVAVVAFGLGVVLVPAAVLAAGEALVGLTAGPRARGALHVVLLGGLAAALALQLLRGSGPLRGAALVAVVVAAGAAFAAAFVRWPVLRSGVRFASAAPAGFLVLFLVASPAADLVRGGVAGAAAPSVGRPAPVVVLVLDELPLASLVGRDGRLDAARYPGFAALAAETTWYRNATAVSNSTDHGVPSLLTGRYPQRARPIGADHPDNLFTLLGEEHRMRVDESITQLCPADLCGGGRSRLTSLRLLGGDAGQVLRERLALHAGEGGDAVAGLVEETDEADRAAGEVGSQLLVNQPTRFTSFLEGLVPDERPAVHYLHLLLPHQPWRYLPSGRTYPFPRPDPGKLEDRWPADPWPAELGRQRHLLQLQYVDGLVGALVARLRETGLLEEAVVAVTSDHGVAFQPGQPVRGLLTEELAPDVHPELMWVPLFLKLPGEPGGVVSDVDAELVDVLPTVADALDAELPWDHDGRSLLGPQDPDDGTKTFFQGWLDDGRSRPGDRVEVDAAAGALRLLERAVPDALQGPDPLAPYRVGPAPDLVGRPAAALRRGPTAAVGGTVDRPGLVRVVDSGSPTVPALVTGRLDSATDDPVVLVLDGEVAAVVPTFGDPASPAFAALLPEPLLEDGAGRLELHLLDDGALRPVET